MVVIRALKREDLGAILQLDSITAETPHWSKSAYEAFLAGGAGKRLLVALLDDEFVGFIAAAMAADICELESIAVAGGARRKGIGAALLDGLLRWTSEWEASHIELEVRAGNQTALEFYVKHGFKRDGVRKGYYRDPDEDAVLMSKALWG